jgi:hypothetical protein
MSVVTGIVICHSCVEGYEETDDGSDKYAVIEELNDFLKKYEKSPLHRLDEHMCNGKHPQMIVWGGGYNYFPNEEFLEFFRSRKWNEREEVFMVFNPEEGPISIVRPTTKSKDGESK